MKLERLGDNLFKLKLGWFCWSPAGKLVEAILGLQGGFLAGEVKVVTHVMYFCFFSSYYLICTTSK